MSHQDGLPVKGKPSRAQAARRKPPAIPIARASAIWLANVREPNASQKSIDDFAATVRHFGWWLEHEASCETTLENLPSTQVCKLLGEPI